jgi:hypothetical protein
MRSVKVTIQAVEDSVCRGAFDISAGMLRIWSDVTFSVASLW